MKSCQSISYVHSQLNTRTDDPYLTAASRGGNVRVHPIRLPTTIVLLAKLLVQAPSPLAISALVYLPSIRRIHHHDLRFLLERHS